MFKLQLMKSFKFSVFLFFLKMFKMFLLDSGNLGYMPLTFWFWIAIKEIFPFFNLCKNHLRGYLGEIDFWWNPAATSVKIQPCLKTEKWILTLKVLWNKIDCNIPVARRRRRGAHCFPDSWSLMLGTRSTAKSSLNE